MKVAYNVSMDGIRFYLEFESPAKKRKGEHSGNCLALFAGREYRHWDPSANDVVIECIGSVFDDPDSPCAGTAVAQGILAKRFKRVTEAKAREIHPALFARLEMT